MGNFICLYVELLGHPKLRALYKALNISQMYAVGILVSLWSWALPNTGDYGNLISVEKDDIVVGLAAMDARSSLNMEDVVESLIDIGWIDREDDGSFSIHDWEIWQAYFIKYRQKCELDVKRKRLARQLKSKPDGVRGQSADSPPEVPTEIPQQESIDIPSENPPNSPKKSDYSTDFEEFWDVYPRKEDKGNANKKFSARLKDGYSPQSLIAAAANYSRTCSANRTEKKYIKHAKTFLSDALPFLDYLPQENQKPSVDGENPFEEWGKEDG